MFDVIGGIPWTILVDSGPTVDLLDNLMSILVHLVHLVLLVAVAALVVVNLITDRHSPRVARRPVPIDPTRRPDRRGRRSGST